MRHYFLVLLFCVAGTGQLNGYQSGALSAMPLIEGKASWYAEFSPGIKKTTANMEIFDDERLTCAIWDIPFDTYLKVTNLRNNRSVIVRVNDRGPAKRLKGRVIDLTKASFERIARLEKGLIDVKVEILEDYSPILS